MPTKAVAAALLLLCVGLLSVSGLMHRPASPGAPAAARSEWADMEQRDELWAAADALLRARGDWLPIPSESPATIFRSRQRPDAWWLVWRSGECHQAVELIPSGDSWELGAVSWH